MANAIVIADAQATPVNHTFTPIGKDANGVFWFEDSSQATPAGFWRIGVDVRRPALAQPGMPTGQRNYKVKVTLYQPTLENVSNSTVTGIAPAPTIAYTQKFSCEYLMPERTSGQNRKDVAKMAPLILQDAQIKALIENLTYLQ